MTEFEASCKFVQQYAHAVLTSGRNCEPSAEWSAFWRYCTGSGIGPTEERLALAQEVIAAVRGYVAWPDEDIRGNENPAKEWDADGEDEDGPAEAGKCVREELFDGGDLGMVPLPYLVETLGCFGWREAFLTREVRA